jgi:hypothetical protein
MVEKVSPRDARHLKRLAEILDKPLLHCFIISPDPETRNISPQITAVHGLNLTHK